MSNEEARQLLPAATDPQIANRSSPSVSGMAGRAAACHAPSGSNAMPTCTRLARDFISGASAQGPGPDLPGRRPHSGDTRLARIMEYAGYVEAIPGELIAPAATDDMHRSFDDLIAPDRSLVETARLSTIPIHCSPPSCAQLFAHLPAEERARRNAVNGGLVLA